jgi:hypothetical protein
MIEGTLALFYNKGKLKDMLMWGPGKNSIFKELTLINEQVIR